jgi:hypothetical protein
MNADSYALAATIILLLPMFYFFFASLAFFLRQFSDPVVTWLLRGLFDTYFLAVVGCCALAILAFLAAGRPGVAAGLGLVAALALGARRWFLRQLDNEIRARDAGDGGAPRQMRRLHVGGILYNAMQGALVIASIPRIFPGL